MENILVIDDEKPILNMFGLLLKFYGYSVLTAENGADGLEIFRQNRPSIVFLDIKMPGMDGFEVLEKIKAIDPETEVIIITGHGDKELEKQALELQASDFINKPFQRETLNEALKRLQERRKKKREICL